MILCAGCGKLIEVVDETSLCEQCIIDMTSKEISWENKNAEKVS